jgi:hypothetical protein
MFTECSLNVHAGLWEYTWSGSRVLAVAGSGAVGFAINFSMTLALGRTSALTIVLLGQFKTVPAFTKKYDASAQWLDRLQNRDRRFMLSFTTVGVGLCKSAQRPVSVFLDLLNRHQKSVKTDGFL